MLDREDKRRQFPRLEDDDVGASYKEDTKLSLTKLCKESRLSDEAYPLSAGHIPPDRPEYEFVGLEHVDVDGLHPLTVGALRIASGHIKEKAKYDERYKDFHPLTKMIDLAVLSNDPDMIFKATKELMKFMVPPASSSMPANAKKGDAVSNGVTVNIVQVNESMKNTGVMFDG